MLHLDGARLEQLADKLKAAQTRRDELRDLSDQGPLLPDQERTRILQRPLDQAVKRGRVPTTKAVLQELVAVVHVHDRKRIQPVIRLPVSAVRTPARLAAPNANYPNTPVLVERPAIVLTPPNAVLRRGSGDK